MVAEVPSIARDAALDLISLGRLSRRVNKAFDQSGPLWEGLLLVYSTRASAAMWEEVPVGLWGG
jgi:hypothetical protein